MTTETLNELALAKGNTFVWHEVRVPDAKSAIDFYTQAFGFGSKDMEMGDFTYHTLTRDGQPVAGIMSTEDPNLKGTPPQWVTFISVDDVDSRLKKCQELGAKLITPAMDVEGVGRMAMIADNQGAQFWIFKAAR